MPTYEYRCRDCGEHLEVVQSFRDDPLTDCPACGGSLRKVFGSIGITFKGSGFYKTDSRAASGGKKKKKAEGEAATASSGSSDSSPSSSSGSEPSGSSGASRPEKSASPSSSTGTKTA